MAFRRHCSKSLLSKASVLCNEIQTSHRKENTNRTEDAASLQVSLTLICFLHHRLGSIQSEDSGGQM